MKSMAIFSREKRNFRLLFPGKAEGVYFFRGTAQEIVFLHKKCVFPCHDAARDTFGILTNCGEHVTVRTSNYYGQDIIPESMGGAHGRHTAGRAYAVVHRYSSDA